MDSTVTSSIILGVSTIISSIVVRYRSSKKVSNSEDSKIIYYNSNSNIFENFIVILFFIVVIFWFSLIIMKYDKSNSSILFLISSSLIIIFSLMPMHGEYEFNLKNTLFWFIILEIIILLGTFLLRNLIEPDETDLNNILKAFFIILIVGAVIFSIITTINEVIKYFKN